MNQPVLCRVATPRRLWHQRYRLITTLLDRQCAPAQELAELYQSRWTVKITFAEMKTTLKGADVVMRSKTPELVRQEFWGLLLAHYLVRKLMLEAALTRDRETCPIKLPSIQWIRMYH
jgi:IS4 transposase